MLIKHLSHGSGRAGYAAEYLLQEHDSKGALRDEVTVLRGDPHMVAQVADSLSFKEKYTSGVIAWSPDDMPNDEQIISALDDYELLAFAGLDPANYCFSAVLHRESNGGVHIHTFSARVDLATGKSFNSAPPGHQKQFDEIVHHHNWANGWARPDDPERARTCSKGHFHYRDAAELKTGLEVEPDAHAALTSYFEAAILNGLVRNRADIKKELEVQGVITRESDHFISVKLPNNKKPTRLRGTIYERDFDAATYTPPARTAAENRGIDLEKSQAARVKFERICEKRAEFNRKKYQRVDSKDRGANQQIRQINDTSVSVNGSINDPDLGRYLRGQLGDDAISIQLNSSQEPAARGNQTEFEPVQRVGASQRQHLQGRGANITDSQTQDLGIKNGQLDNRDREVDRNGRNRNDIAEQISAAERAKRAVSGAGARLSTASGGLATAAAGAVRAVKRSMSNCNDELERFKSEIELPRYLYNQGYEYDLKKSTLGYKVMKNAHEKVIITRKPDNHYVYINPHNDKDCGSIIDFVKTRRGLNLGQIRKELRPWIGGGDPPKPVKTRKILPDKQHQIVKTDPDYGRIALTWLNASEVFDYKYLRSRGIRPATIKKYGDSVKQSKNSTLLFKHLGAEGVAGYEYKSDTAAGFSSGGRKGLCVLRPQGDQVKIKKMVITETALDALAYAQIDKCREDTAYVSTGGNCSAHQVAQIKAVVERFEMDVIHAHDADLGGDRQAAALQKEVGGERHRPRHKDWCEEVELHRDRGISL